MPMTRKEKIAEELARAKERRAALDKRIEELELIRPVDDDEEEE